MAKVITRTLKTTNITALFADTEKQTMGIEVVVAPTTFKDEVKAMKYLAANSDEGKVPVKIEKMEVKSTLYAITEKDFLEHSHPVEKSDDND